MTLSTPVGLIIFRRPEHAAKVFAEIRRTKPKELFIIADGPRPDHPEDVELCQQAREVVANVDWDCEVYHKYAETNMGLMKRVSSGLNWVFEHVERACILEDDMVPHPDFFPYCEALLEKYADDTRVMVISGVNPMMKWKPRRASYSFVKRAYIGGWATWRRAWQHYDPSLENWRDRAARDIIAEYINDELVFDRISRGLNNALEGKTDTWAWRWTYSCMLHRGLTILPSVNLISHIGLDGSGTHITTPLTHLLAVQETYSVRFPLRHPNQVEADPVAERRAALGLRSKTLKMRLRETQQKRYFRSIKRFWGRVRLYVRIRARLLYVFIRGDRIT